MILDNLSLFQYYFYFDNVRSNLEVDEVIKSIVEKRITKFNLKSAQTDNFKEEFTKLVNEDIDDMNYFLDKYESEDFDLEIRKVNPKNNKYYRVKLNYNFDFPEIFSKEIIEEVFNSDITAEDKLFVEYPMIANIALKDIIIGNFTKMYICEFCSGLLKKKKKLEQLLEILNNPAAQDKILFEINYEEFKDNKNELFSIINKGFKFALKTNDNMPKLSTEELNIVEIFECIIISNNDVNKNDYKNTKIIEK